MSNISSEKAGPSILIVGASRGLGFAMAREFVGRRWNVLGTTRGGETALHVLAANHPDAVAIETLDIGDADQIAALRDRLADRLFDIMFVNAGTANRRQDETIAQVSTDEFVRVMVTNALDVMRTVEALGALTPPDGMIAVMSSGQGSIANNINGRHEVYRGSKAALNQYMRSYAARHVDGSRSMILMAPGWIRTELGGPDAPFSIEETVPDIVDVLIAQQRVPGLRYLDRKGQTLPW